MNFDPMSPIWLQVATRLKQQIVTGGLPPGSKLPGGRDLAIQYGGEPGTGSPQRIAAPAPSCPRLCCFSRRSESFVPP